MTNHDSQPVVNPAIVSTNVKEIVFWIVLFLVMIMGMMAKSVIDYMQTGRDVSLSIDTLFNREMLLPLLISLMIFGVIYGMVKQSLKKRPRLISVCISKRIFLESDISECW